MSQSPRRQAPEVFLSNKQHLEEQLLHTYDCPHHFAFMEQERGINYQLRGVL